MKPGQPKYFWLTVLFLKKLTYLTWFEEACFKELTSACSVFI